MNQRQKITIAAVGNVSRLSGSFSTGYTSSSVRAETLPCAVPLDICSKACVFCLHSNNAPKNANDFIETFAGIGTQSYGSVRSDFDESCYF